MYMCVKKTRQNEYTLENEKKKKKKGKNKRTSYSQQKINGKKTNQQKNIIKQNAGLVMKEQKRKERMPVGIQKETPEKYF